MVSRLSGCQLRDGSKVPRTGIRGSRAEVKSPPAVLRSRAVRVRVPRMRMHDPALRPPSADDATQKHRAAIAGNCVVVPRHVTIDPAPHNHLPEHRCGAEWQGQCHVHGRLPYMKTCAEWDVSDEKRKFNCAIRSSKLHAELRFRNGLSLLAPLSLAPRCSLLAARSSLSVLLQG